MLQADVGVGVPATVGCMNGMCPMRGMHCVGAGDCVVDVGVMHGMLATTGQGFCRQLGYSRLGRNLGLGRGL